MCQRFETTEENLTAILGDTYEAIVRIACRLCRSNHRSSLPYRWRYQQQKTRGNSRGWICGSDHYLYLLTCILSFRCPPRPGSGQWNPVQITWICWLPHEKTDHPHEVSAFSSIIKRASRTICGHIQKSFARVPIHRHLTPCPRMEPCFRGNSECSLMFKDPRKSNTVSNPLDGMPIQHSTRHRKVSLPFCSASWSGG